MLTRFEGLLLGAEDPVAFVLFRIVAGHTILLQDRLDVFHEVNARRHTEGHPGRPVRALFDPGFNYIDLALIEEAFLFRWHHHVIVVCQNKGLVQRAFG